MATLTPPKNLSEWHLNDDERYHDPHRQVRIQVAEDGRAFAICDFDDFDGDEATALYVLTACKAIGPMVEALTRLRNECDLSGLRDRAGFDCWLGVADEALALAEPKL